MQQTVSQPTAAADENRDAKFKKEGPAPAAATTVQVPRSYALVMGISRHKNLPEDAQLQYPDVDAESVYKVLISSEGGQYPGENAHKLIHSRATLANIQDKLETWLPSVTHPDDRVLIYFAGHGFVSNGTAYIAPHDIDLKNIAATAYPMESLGKDIGSRINGKWTVLITDSCHSGAITPEADPS